ncbi:MAG: tetratricopeptide repeat protein [Saprospiraceae bacterium]|nr:tetratricopeptide repeat protein [Saprospiraceae bacterium]
MAKKKKPTAPVPAWFKHTWWLIPLIALLIYIPSFNADYTLDDVLIVEDNSFVKSPDQIPAIWTSHYWAGKVDATDTGLYRPLTLTTYNIQYALTGETPAPFHIVNILLHALVCLMLMKMASLLFVDFRLVIISGLLFAIHPIHTEAVAGIVGRAEILAALFILTSMICYHHWRLKGKIKWLVLLLVSSFAAMTSKEHGFLMIAILALQETYYFFTTKKLPWNERKNWIAFGSVAILSLGLWMVRSTITGPTASHELWANVGSTERMATSLRTSAEYIGLHLWPSPLSADYWSDEVPIVGFGNIKVVIASLIILGILSLAYYLRRKIPVASWGILFFFLMLLPVSNFVFPAGFLKAERILYIPSIGLILLMSVMLTKVIDFRTNRIPGFILLGLFILLFSWRTWTRSADWENNYTLAIATLQTSPNSPRFNNMMGLELRAQNKNNEALVYFEKAVKANPNHVPALVNLGMEYSHFGRHQEAGALLEKALALEPGTLATYANLMSVYRSTGAHEKNIAIAEKAMHRFPQSAAIMWNAANAYHLAGNMARANELRAIALSIDPNIGGGK